MESQRVLVPGGRLILVEPAVTPVSWFFYRFFHPERVDFSADPLTRVDRAADKDPYDGNQAIPMLLFGKDDGRLREVMPRMELRHKSFLSLFAYPLSGGFRRWSLLPEPAARRLLKLEDRMLPALGRWLAFRKLIVLERVKRT
jgi:hypothetical protein